MNQHTNVEAKLVMGGGNYLVNSFVGGWGGGLLITIQHYSMLMIC